MAELLAAFGWGLIAAIGHVATVLVGIHASRRLDPWKAQMFSAVLWGVAIIVLSTMVPSGGLLWHSLLLLGCAFASLAFAYGAVSKSISLIMLNSLLEAGGVAPLAAAAQGSVRRELDSRIQLLVDQGLVTQQGGYALTDSGRKVAETIARAREFFGIGTGAFYGSRNGDPT